MMESLGLVVIGKNEGDRLKRCLGSLPLGSRVVYVDSGSTDDSIAWAEQQNFNVVSLDLRFPFTAARARNAGYQRLQEISPNLSFIQFVDGDCELAPYWVEQAIAFLETRPDVCAVFGRRRERYPESSVYNYLCDVEWNVPIGESRAFGGDVMIRADAFTAVRGYREDLIAGEEPELCVRLRHQGWKIWRLDSEMTRHDAAMTHFSQWWKRNVRSGYAFAQGAHLHGHPPERHWVRESRRALFWGLILPMGCLISTALIPIWGITLWLAYPAQIVRRTMRMHGDLRSNMIVAMFELLAKFPEVSGQLKFAVDLAFRRQSTIIEYK